MATTALSFSSFRVLCAGARPKNKSGPRRKPFPKKPAEPPKPNLSTTPSSRSTSSRTVLPTTYAKLPLLDDEDEPMEITLEEFEKMRKELKKKVQKKKQPTRNANVSRFVQDILDDVDDDDDEMEDFEADSFSGEDEEEGEEIFLDSGFDSKPESKSRQNWDEEEEEGEEGKEKGVPAVMRCFDTAKIYAKAGDGGNGVVAFRREKFVPYGGPSGGDGGQGGQIYVEVDPSINSLLPFRKTLHFRAGRGSHGQGSKQGGAKGEDVVIMVPPGTVIREAVKGESGEGEKLLELLGPGQKALLLPGGRGGRGNASFKTGNNKVPKIAERGEEGAEMWLELEMKLVADVGIVGAPNAGKSTLLAAVSAAQPEIASYPFTTLLPNLGVVSLDFHATMVVADLPGLLEGAHRGYGLGHEFLRHSERCHTLIHVVDGSGEQPEYEYDAVRLELELFSPTLAEKPYIVLFNKMDLSEAFDKWESFERKLKKNGIPVYCGSAINKQGTHEVISSAYELLQKERKGKKKVEEWEGEQDLNHVAETIRKEKSVPMSEFEISHQNGPNGTMTWIVDGAGIQRFVQMTNWRYSESLRRFQSALEACGVNKYLIKSGVKEGDTVIVGEMELIWHDEHEKEGRRTKSSSKGRSGEGSIKWPKF